MLVGVRCCVELPHIAAACHRRTTETGADAEKMAGGMSDRQSNGAA